MNQILSAFKIKLGDKILDYRQGKPLDLTAVRRFIEAKDYRIEKLYGQPRHILATLTKNQQRFFFKLATSEGINLVTENEYQWNGEINKFLVRDKTQFWLPTNFDCGYFQNSYFYLITDFFDGKLLVEARETKEDTPLLEKNLERIIDFSEAIQKINLPALAADDYIFGSNHREKFLNKTYSWYKSIPSSTITRYQLNKLLQIVKETSSQLQNRPRHGDFAPWHLLELKNGCLGLIDAEHAMASGVENYDIGYFIQRVYNVLKNPPLAKKLFQILLKRGYQKNKLKTVLAARAIGGFLDESLAPSPDYSFAESFKDWVMRLL